MTNNIKPYGNNIIVKPIEKEQIIVGDSKSLQQYGTVIAVGSDVKDIEVGQTAFYTVWGLKDVEYEGEKVYFMPCDSRFFLGTLHE